LEPTRSSSSEELALLNADVELARKSADWLTRELFTNRFSLGIEFEPNANLLNRETVFWANDWSPCTSLANVISLWANDWSPGTSVVNVISPSSDGTDVRVLIRFASLAELSPSSSETQTLFARTRDNDERASVTVVLLSNSALSLVSFVKDIRVLDVLTALWSIGPSESWTHLESNVLEEDNCDGNILPVGASCAICDCEWFLSIVDAMADSSTSVTLRFAFERGQRRLLWVNELNKSVRLVLATSLKLVDGLPIPVGDLLILSPSFVVDELDGDG
jgi:hypothetical protein